MSKSNTMAGNSYSISHAKEAYGKVKVNIEFLGIDNSYKSLLFSSSVAGEGKTTTVANIATSLAASDKKVLLVDADLRHPTQHKLFNVINRIGLSDILANNLDWHDYIIAVEEHRSLFILTAGRIPPNPSEMLGSNKMGELMKELRNEFDYILFDSSPMLLVPDAISLSKHVDGIIVIVRYNFSTLQALSDIKDIIKPSNRPLVGAILNNVSANDNRYYGYGYGKKSGYSHGYYGPNSDINK